MNPPKSRTSEKIAKQLSTLRQRKIKQLKLKIEAGQYQIDNAALARALFLAR